MSNGQSNDRAGLFVALGTGVGGAILLDGELYRGAKGLAGELGHMTVDIHGAPCPCGNRGCLETYVGSRHIVERARRLVRSGAPGQVIDALADGEDGLSPETLARAAAEGDWTARAAFAEAGRILGIALAGVMNLLSLDVIVIGGGVSAAGDSLWEPVTRAFRAHCMVPPDRQPAVLSSQFGTQAGLVGAGAWARDHATD